MDRNNSLESKQIDPSVSLSVRRAWIEMTTYLETSSIDDVALRKESVDRNIIWTVLFYKRLGRSP